MKDDLFKRMGFVFGPEPIEEIENICKDAGLREAPKTFEEYIDEERPTLNEVYALKCAKAKEWQMEKFIFKHEGEFYFVKWKPKGGGFEFWCDTETIELL